MPALWLPGAQRIDVGDHAPTDSTYPAKAIAHITWDKNATAAHPQDQVPYGNLQEWFGRNPDGKPSAPHLLWSPFTGAFTQFFPANSRSKSLVDLSGGTRTNRAGTVVIQIESHFFPYCRVGGKVYARLVDTPCTGWATLNAWVRSWGVPDTWPMGRPVDFTSHRNEHVWETQGGWYGHQQVPENTHQDPGSWPQFTGAPPKAKVSLTHVVAAARRDPGLPRAAPRTRRRSWSWSAPCKPRGCSAPPGWTAPSARRRRRRTPPGSGGAAIRARTRMGSPAVTRSPGSAPATASRSSDTGRSPGAPPNRTVRVAPEE